MQFNLNRAGRDYYTLGIIGA
jgi:GTPase SAR1 family protein